MIAGSLTYNTEMDTKGFQKGINDVTNKTKSAGTSIKSIIAGLGITKIINKAFNLITSNIDNAVKRLDTLNNFPKVMRNLGIGANESTEAIKQLSDNLQGLPTTLNDGALAVQRFTSKNGNVKKSVELFTAVNNAILAGGASAEIQATALEQLSQAYAKGKPDMMEWRSIQTAMPAQLKQVAQAMGYVSTDKLGEALRNGKVSMDSFMNTIVKLNKEGTGQFLSFEQQAKNSVGGIGTSLQNMRTAVIRGVTTIIQSIDTSLKNAGFGGISDIITKIGQSIEKALKKVAEFIEKIDWKKVVETIKSIIPVLSAVVAGFLAMQVIESVSGFIQDTIKGVNGLGIAIKLLMAHPIIAVITAVIAALVLLYEKCEKFRTIVNELAENLKTGILKVWKDMQPTLEKIGAKISEVWEKIKPKIEKLVESFGRLMKALGPVGEWIVNHIGPAFSNWGDIIIWLIGVLGDIIGFIIDMSIKWNDVLTGIVKFFTSIPENFEKAKNKILEIGNNILTFFKNLWKSIVSFFTETIPTFIQNVIQWISELPEKIITFLSELPYKIGYLLGQILALVIKLYVGIWNWINNDLPKIINGIITWFSELPGRIWQFLSDVVGKIITWGQEMWSTAITWVSNTINGIIAWFSELPGRIWQWLQNTISRIIDFGTRMQEKGKEGAKGLSDNIVNTIKELPGKMLNIGKDIVKGIWDGIQNAKDWLMGKVNSFAKGILDSMKESLGIHSPSTLFRDQVGKFIPQGIAVGIELDTIKAVKAIDDMNNKIDSEMDKAVAFETGKMNASANIKASSMLNNTIIINANFDGKVEMDKKITGQILAPEITKAIKVGGLA